MWIACRRSSSLPLKKGRSPYAASSSGVTHVRLPACLTFFRNDRVSFEVWFGELDVGLVPLRPLTPASVFYGRVRVDILTAACCASVRHPAWACRRYCEVWCGRTDSERCTVGQPLALWVSSPTLGSRFPSTNRRSTRQAVGGEGVRGISADIYTDIQELARYLFLGAFPA